MMPGSRTNPNPGPNERVVYEIPGTGVSQTLLRGEAGALDFTYRLGAEARVSAIKPEIRKSRNEIEHEFNVKILMVAPNQRFEIGGVEIALENYQKIIDHALERFGKSVAPSWRDDIPRIISDPRWIALHSEMLKEAEAFGEQIMKITERTKPMLSEMNSETKKREYDDAFNVYCNGMSKIGIGINDKSQEFERRYHEVRKEIGDASPTLRKADE